MKYKNLTRILILSFGMFFLSSNIYAAVNNMSVVPLFETKRPVKTCNQKVVFANTYPEGVTPSALYYLLAWKNPAVPMPAACLRAPDLFDNWGTGAMCKDRFMVLGNSLPEKYLVQANLMSGFPSFYLMAIAFTNQDVSYSVPLAIDTNTDPAACTSGAPIQYLVPGNGLPASLNLGLQGAPSNRYYTRKVVGRVVPLEDYIIGGTLSDGSVVPSEVELSVVAFHPAGIAYVDFINISRDHPAEAGYRRVYTKTIDSHGIEAYVVKARSADLLAGGNDIKIVIVPNVGEKLVIGNDLTPATAEDGTAKITIFNNKPNSLGVQPLPRTKIAILPGGGYSYVFDLSTLNAPVCGSVSRPCNNMGSAIEAARRAAYISGFGNDLKGAYLYYVGPGTDTFGAVQNYGNHTDASYPLIIQGFGNKKTVFDRTALNPNVNASFWGQMEHVIIKNVTLKHPGLGEGPTPGLPIIQSAGMQSIRRLTLVDVYAKGRGINPPDCNRIGYSPAASEVGFGAGGIVEFNAIRYYKESNRENSSRTNSLWAFISNHSGIAFNDKGIFNSGVSNITGGEGIITYCTNDMPHPDQNYNTLGNHVTSGFYGLETASGSTRAQGLFIPSPTHDARGGYFQNGHYSSPGNNALMLGSIFDVDFVDSEFLGTNGNPLESGKRFQSTDSSAANAAHYDPTYASNPNKGVRFWNSLEPLAGSTQLAPFPYSQGATQVNVPSLYNNAEHTYTSAIYVDYTDNP